MIDKGLAQKTKNIFIENDGLHSIIVLFESKIQRKYFETCCLLIKVLNALIDSNDKVSFDLYLKWLIKYRPTLVFLNGYAC